MRTFAVLIKRVLGNLQVRILLIILVFLFTPVIITQNNYFKRTEKILIENTSDLMMNNLKQIGDKVENICLDMITMSNILLTDEVILDNLSIDQGLKFSDSYRIKSFAAQPPGELTRISKVENQINSVKRNIFLDNNAQVIIIGADGNVYSSKNSDQEEVTVKKDYPGRFLDQEWFEIIKSGERRAIWNVPYSYGIEGLGGERYISIVKGIRNKHAPKNVAGVLIISFSEKNLGKILGGNVSSPFALLNETGEVIFSSDKSIEGKILANKDIASRNLYYGSGHFFTEMNKEKYMVNYYSIDRFGFCAMSLTPYTDLIKDINTLQRKINSMNIAIFLAFLIIGTFLIMYILYPIRKLLKRMKKMKVGTYSVGGKESEILDDVNGLVNSFDTMLNRVEELVGIVVEEQKLEKDLRYQTLRAQINPHFLFNTLSAIKWSARMSGASNVSKMVSALGKLLEVSISKGEEQLEFREELELAESYIYIQNVRYNDKFELTLQVEDDRIYSCKVPKLILQPIVENSIIHGFADMEDNCTIVIRARFEENRLLIDVADNGTSMDKDKAEELLNRADESRRKFSGIGLKNVHERIRLKYGESYGLRLSADPGTGTMVTISIPIMD